LSQARTLEDVNGSMQRMMKAALERMLNTEMDVHLSHSSRPAAANMPEPSLWHLSRPPQ
jgi:hypothetical protein